MTERFKNAYDALVKAFYNDHLEYRYPCGCAVGNIIAHCNSFAVNRNYGGCLDWKKEFPFWTSIIKCGYGVPKSPGNIELNLYALRQIETTGYSVDEIALIEQKYAQLSFPDLVDKNGNVDFLCASVDPVKKTDAEMLYELIEFIASLDGDTLDLDENPFEQTEETAYDMVCTS